MLESGCTHTPKVPHQTTTTTTFTTKINCNQPEFEAEEHHLSHRRSRLCRGRRRKRGCSVMKAGLKHWLKRIPSISHDLAITLFQTIRIPLSSTFNPYAGQDQWLPLFAICTIGCLSRKGRTAGLRKRAVIFIVDCAHTPPVGRSKCRRPVPRPPIGSQRLPAVLATSASGISCLKTTSIENAPHASHHQQRLSK